MSILYCHVRQITHLRLPGPYSPWLEMFSKYRYVETLADNLSVEDKSNLGRTEITKMGRADFPALVRILFYFGLTAPIRCGRLACSARCEHAVDATTTAHPRRFHFCTMGQRDSLLPSHSRPRRSKTMLKLGLLGGFSIVALFFFYSQLSDDFGVIPFHHKHHKHKPKNARDIVARCKQLRTHAEPSDDFRGRSASDRFEEGTKPVLIKRAKIWTGRRNGTEVIEGDILLDKGIIKSIGRLDVMSDALSSYSGRLQVLDANSAWVTPGIVDIHSHMGVDPLPILSGAEDFSSKNGPIEPWLRSLDGLNTHDESYPLSIAGGVTTALVLPGSDNAIGGLAHSNSLLVV